MGVGHDSHEPIGWGDLRSSAGPYPPEAFLFVQAALRHTVETRSSDNSDSTDESNHVSGRELCIGIREYAQREYGLLARVVLGSWGVVCTEDFGRIVFGMVEAGLLRKTEEDSMDDFRGVYRFEDAFCGIGTAVATDLPRDGVPR